MPLQLATTFLLALFLAGVLLAGVVVVVVDEDEAATGFFLAEKEANGFSLPDPIILARLVGDTMISTSDKYNPPDGVAAAADGVDAPSSTTTSEELPAAALVEASTGAGRFF